MVVCGELERDRLAAAERIGGDPDHAPAAAPAIAASHRDARVAGEEQLDGIKPSSMSAAQRDLAHERLVVADHGRGERHLEDDAVVESARGARREAGART